MRALDQVLVSNPVIGDELHILGFAAMEELVAGSLTMPTSQPLDFENPQLTANVLVFTVAGDGIENVLDICVKPVPDHVYSAFKRAL